MRGKALLLLIISVVAQVSPSLELKKRIRGNIAPKSIVHSGNGLFFAQNMMYRHTITVYNRDFDLVATISDKIAGNLLGRESHSIEYRGAPVEATFSHSGKYAWVTNYLISGPGFQNPGNDSCYGSGKFDISYVYRINTETMNVDQAVPVGSVPKYIEASPDSRWVFVSNWCSGDLSIIDTERGTEIKRIKVGRYPRGIVVDSASTTAYVAVMGSYDIAVINISDMSLSWMKGIGRSPRHLALDASGQFLYASLNAENRIAKVDIPDRRVVQKVQTGDTPRSIVLSDDGKFLYVVNYESNTLSKVDCSNMSVVETVKTDHHPIGITYDAQSRQVWVSCYSGTILVYQD
ncbi:MAG: YncE family protein [Ignavibacteriales bacterium]|nr:YncE family protein [Ignavibacteriales bacterium]